VPAPNTTAFCMEIFIRTLSATNWTAMLGRARVCTYTNPEVKRLQNRQRAVKPYQCRRSQLKIEQHVGSQSKRGSGVAAHRER
jgi:hypothetical protein